MSQFSFDPGARLPRVAPDEQAGPRGAGGQRAHQRGAQSPNRVVIEGKAAGGSANTVRPEQSRNRRDGVSFWHC